MLKALLWVLKSAADKLLGEAVDWKFVGAWLLAGSLAFATAAGTVLNGSFTLRGWWLAAILGYTLTASGCAFVLMYQARKRRGPKKFREVRVKDHRGGFDYSDRGINGFLTGHDRRNKIHEEAQT